MEVIVFFNLRKLFNFTSSVVGQLVYIEYMVYIINSLFSNTNNVTRNMHVYTL